MSQLQRRDSKRPNIRSVQPNPIQTNKKPSFKQNLDAVTEVLSVFLQLELELEFLS